MYDEYTQRPMRKMVPKPSSNGGDRPVGIRVTKPTSGGPTNFVLGVCVGIFHFLLSPSCRAGACERFVTGLTN